MLLYLVLMIMGIFYQRGWILDLTFTKIFHLKILANIREILFCILIPGTLFSNEDSFSEEFSGYWF